jgi:hypothetical protein
MKSGTAATSSFTTVWRRFLTLRWPRGIAIVFCGVLGTLLPAIYGLHAGVREPIVHDEFSYLLAADTFAHGRLTNPTPPHPEFFEAPHILVVPSYGSKYPPGQGLMLAVGQLVGGRPIWGVWLSCGLFAAALCWMLQAWSSPPWALATTFLAIATCGVSSYWAQSYWGGMVAASGGALLFGALRRTLRRPRVGPSLWMGAGIIILANTRPFEGLLACAATAAALLIWFFRDRTESLAAKLARWLLPVCAVLVIGFLWTAYYNRAVTGNWLTPPYVLHEQQYFDQGVFRFSAPRVPDRTPAPRVAAFYASYKTLPERGVKLVITTLAAFYRNLAMTVESALGMTLDTRGSPSARLWLLALVATISLCSRSVWFCVGCICLVVLGTSLVWWWFPHYVSPVYPLEVAVVAITLRRAEVGTRAIQPTRRAAPLIVSILAALFIGFPVLYSTARARFARPEVGNPQAAHPTAVSEHLSRTALKRKLEQESGKQLVFVRYSPDFSIHDEWVYNGADLAGSAVIFAHDLGTAKNAELIAAYPSRRTWLVQVSPSETRLEPYPHDRKPKMDGSRRDASSSRSG